MFKSHMQIALTEAKAAFERREVPVGAVIVSGEGRVLSRASNRTRELCDPSAHAEILAIREACRLLKSDRLIGCDLYVTLEPCAMCAGAIAAARLSRLYYGASDPKSGGVEQGACVFSHSQSHHRPEVYSNILEQPSAELLKAFFNAKRS